MSDNAEIINSIDRALDVILLLYKERREMGVSEIGRELKIHKSTIHRTLATLEQKGFIYQNTESGKYWLGMKLYAIGMVTGEKNKLNQIVKPFAKRLAEKFNETVNVSILDTSGDMPRTMVIHKEENLASRLRISHEIGVNYSCYSTSVGKSLLAFSDEKWTSAFKDYKFREYTQNTIKSYDALVKELEKVKLQGYAIDNEEEDIGLTCFSAPILDNQNRAVAAISLSGPTSRMNKFDIHDIIQSLKDTAYEISNIMN